MSHFLQNEIQKLIDVLNQIQQNELLLKRVNAIAEICIAALQNGKKILFAGNGGSAADAQHLAAELVGRLRYDRPALAAIALTTDTSILTAIGNDHAFEFIFSRQVEALGQPGDVFIGISTSGKSANVLRALEAARQKKLVTIGLTGKNGAAMNAYCDEVIHVPSDETSKIQECHIMFGHVICALIENALFAVEYDSSQFKNTEMGQFKNTEMEQFENTEMGQFENTEMVAANEL